MAASCVSALRPLPGGAASASGSASCSGSEPLESWNECWIEPPDSAGPEVGSNRVQSLSYYLVEEDRARDLSPRAPLVARWRALITKLRLVRQRQLQFYLYGEGLKLIARPLRERLGMLGGLRTRA
jgi:hypothetical protein